MDGMDKTISLTLVYNYEKNRVGRDYRELWPLLKTIYIQHHILGCDIKLDFKLFFLK